MNRIEVLMPEVRLCINTLIPDTGIPSYNPAVGSQDFDPREQVAWTVEGGSVEKLLTSAGVNHEYIVRSGSHNWEFWRGCTPKLIEKTGAILD